jgi:hypothetical protein
MRQHLVGAVADEDPGRRHRVAAGHRGLQQVGVGVGIEAQAGRIAIEFRLDRGQRLRRRRKGFSLVLSLIRLAILGCSPGT